MHWNLHVHPLGDYIYSDMGGYVSRADRLLRDPWGKHEYSAFFPFGTHMLVAAIKAVFGKENYTAVGIVWALLGAGAVTMAYATARRMSAYTIVPLLVGAIGIGYYPLLSLGGYILSETPFSFFLAGAVLASVRLADDGRSLDAWLMGLFCGLGALFRPQILLSAACVGLFWLIRRKDLPKIGWFHIAQSGVPLLMFVALGSAHLHYHTGRRGLISENGSFNLVFGRCHNGKIESKPDGHGHGRVHFRPPPILQLEHQAEKAAKAGLQPKVDLDPAFGSTFSYKGFIGDREIHKAHIRRCIAETGWWRQLKYSWVNASLLWSHNIPWPDSGRRAWRLIATPWTTAHQYTLAIPALFSLLLLGFPGQRGAKRGLVAVNLVALLSLAAIFFGGTRHRAPYDYIILMLALEVYCIVAFLIVRAVRRAPLSPASWFLQPDTEADDVTPSRSPL